jgi:hypothetical protein
MKEDFLHYVWKFQKFDGINFFTSNRENLHIINPGGHNVDSGPDFFNAQVEIDGQIWAGNVEIHIKSSDWYAHNHQLDPAYDNVILHVVWAHDTEIFRRDGTTIPTLILKEKISKNTLSQYQQLFSNPKKWIYCENDFGNIDSFTMDNWLERLYLERLERRNAVLQEELNFTQNHWEALFFRMLCKNFGLKINGESFLSIAQSIDFSIISKCSHDLQTLEAVLLGQAGLLNSDKSDWYSQKLKSNYEYVKHKYSLINQNMIAPKFFRLRPPNFPTIRFAQLAALYAKEQTLFSKIIELKTTEEFYGLFNVDASEYWDTHYNFGISSLKRKKKITKKFINLLIINTVLPIKFCYARQHGKDVLDEIIEIAMEIPAEENTIVKKFNSLKKIATTSFHSQALLELKGQYCDKTRCLQCAVGNAILAAIKNPQDVLRKST